MSEDRDIAIGQVWESDTGLKWRVLAIGPGNYVTVQRVDSYPWRDLHGKQYVWHPASVRACSRLVHQPNARFWTWENGGWVKLTLKPGQTLRWVSGVATDEGYFNEYRSWEYDANEGVVIADYANESRDCDGRHSYHATCNCLIGELQAIPPVAADPENWIDEIPVPRPNWVRGASSQRDRYAEAMGY